MAIQKEYQYKGLTIPNAYFKIQPDIFLSYKEDLNTMYISVYADVEAREADIVLESIKDTVHSSELEVLETDGDYRDRFYRWLKTQEGWENSIDC